MIILFAVILSWLVDKEVAGQALKKDILIEEDRVECRPEKVSDAICDENVDIHLVRKCFTHDAWLVLENMLSQKTHRMTWVCNVCYHDLHAESSGPSVICDCCLKWFHFTCVGIVKQPKATNWFCRSCYAATK